MTPIMYILMRSDMASLNPGKAMAQATHAATKLATLLSYKIKDPPKLYEQYIFSADGFGTTIVLDIGNQQTLEETMKEVNDLASFSCTVEDRTYPVRDGKVTHLLSVVTCGAILGYKEELEPILARFPLYR